MELCFVPRIIHCGSTEGLWRKRRCYGKDMAEVEYEVREVVSSSEDEASYLRFVDAAADVHIAQAPQWPGVKKGWTVRRFLATGNDGAVHGTAQVLIINDARLGGDFYYVPRGPVGDQTDFDLQHALLDAVVSSAQQADGKLVRIDPNWVASDATREQLARLAQSFPGSVLRTSEEEKLKGQPQLSMILDLHDYSDYDEWFAAISGKRRGHIRRAERNGVVTQISHDRELVELLYRNIEMTAVRQGISHRPKQYFYDLFDAFGANNVYFTLGLVDDYVASISINVHYGQTVNNLYTGNDLSYQKLQVPSAGNAAMVGEALRRGARYVDFGGVFGTTKEDHLYAFKIGYMPSPQDVTHFAGEIDIVLG